MLGSFLFGKIENRKYGWFIALVVKVRPDITTRNERKSVGTIQFQVERGDSIQDFFGDLNNQRVQKYKLQK